MQLNLNKELAEYCSKNKKHLYVMYGQTEASPRISYVPYKMALKKIGSIGVPIPDGELSLVDSNGQLISSFVEHQFVNNGYVQTDFFASDTTQEFNLNLINPHTNSSNYQQPPVKLIFNLPNAASNLKISIEALAPTQFPSGCSQASYLAIIPAGYNNGVGGSPSLDYLNTVNSGPLTVKVFR